MARHKLVDGVPVPFTAEEEAARDAEEAAWSAEQPALEAEAARKAAIEDVIQADATIAQIKAMTTAEFDTWWTANVTNAAQAINVLKRVTRVVIRRLL